MTERDNLDRLGISQDSIVPIANTPTLSYISPTELVDLPSEGKFYPPGHPLRDKKEIELKYMTAKEEDILTSKSLLKKGVAIDKMLESLLVEKIRLDDLILGDKNALILAARKSGYGPVYETQVTCPKCEKKTKFTFNLDEIKNKVLVLDSESVKTTDTGTFNITLPRTQAILEVRALTGKDEKTMTSLREQREKAKVIEATSTTQMKLFIVSVNGDRSSQTIEKFVDAMPAFDAKFLRKTFKNLSPDVDMTQHFACPQCEHEEDIEVPLTTEFFWPE